MFAATLSAFLFLAARSYSMSAVERPGFVFPSATEHQSTGAEVSGGAVIGGGEEGEKGVPDDPLGVWAEFGDDDADPTNSCYLISWQDGVKAAYLCQDGTLWEVNIESEGDRCVYNRTVTNSFGEATSNEAAINCLAAREWIRGLVQTDVIAGIPDSHFFDANATALPSTTEPPAITPDPPTSSADPPTSTDDSPTTTANQQEGCT